MRASKRYAPINPLSPASIPEETEMTMTTPQPPFRRFQDQRYGQINLWMDNYVDKVTYTYITFSIPEETEMTMTSS